MENLIGVTSSENTRTPIQKEQNALKALIAEQKELAKMIKPIQINKYRMLSNNERIKLSNTRAKFRGLESKINSSRTKINQLKKNQTRKNLLNKGSLDYIVITKSDLKDFQNTVMSKLIEGYTLQGGVSVSQIGYSQALIKQKIAKNLLSNNVNLLQL